MKRINRIEKEIRNKEKLAPVRRTAMPAQESKMWEGWTLDMNSEMSSSNGRELPRRSNSASRTASSITNILFPLRFLLLTSLNTVTALLFFSPPLSNFCARYTSFSPDTHSLSVKWRNVRKEGSISSAETYMKKREIRVLSGKIWRRRIRTCVKNLGSWL